MDQLRLPGPVSPNRGLRSTSLKLSSFICLHLRYQTEAPHGHTHTHARLGRGLGQGHLAAGLHPDPREEQWDPSQIPARGRWETEVSVNAAGSWGDVTRGGPWDQEPSSLPQSWLGRVELPAWVKVQGPGQGGWAKARPPTRALPQGGPELKSRVWVWASAPQDGGMAGQESGGHLGTPHGSPSGPG